MRDTLSKGDTDLLDIPGTYAQASRPAAVALERPGEMSLEFVAAIIFAVAACWQTPVSLNLSFGAVLAGAMLPVVLLLLARFPRGRLVMTMWSFALASGVVTSWIARAADPGRAISGSIRLYEAAFLAGLLLSISGMLWSLSLLGPSRFLLAFGLSFLVAAPQNFGRFAENPWKYGGGFAVCVITLLFVSRRSIAIQTVVVAILCGISVISESRSWMVILLVALLVSWYSTARSNPSRPPKRDTLKILLLGALFLYLLSVTFTAIATAGLLGSGIQDRTVQQLYAADGNLVLGSRPEWGGAIAFAKDAPFGIGLGVTPSSSDLTATLDAMPYFNPKWAETSDVANAMRRGLPDFHSTLWNMFAQYGVGGFAFALSIVALVISALLSIAQGALTRKLRLVCTFVLIAGLQEIFFSSAKVATLALTTTLALYVLAQTRRVPPQVIGGSE